MGGRSKMGREVGGGSEVCAGACSRVDGAGEAADEAPAAASATQQDALMAAAQLPAARLPCSGRAGQRQRQGRTPLCSTTRPNQPTTQPNRTTDRTLKVFCFLSSSGSSPTAWPACHLHHHHHHRRRAKPMNMITTITEEERKLRNPPCNVQARCRQGQGGGAHKGHAHAPKPTGNSQPPSFSGLPQRPQRPQEEGLLTPRPLPTTAKPRPAAGRPSARTMAVGVCLARVYLVPRQGQARLMVLLGCSTHTRTHAHVIIRHHQAHAC